jgi:hypothetical protein
MKKREARYLVLENPSTDEPMFGPSLQLESRDTFPTIQDALNYIMEDAQAHYCPDPDTPIGDPDAAACSRKMIVKVIQIVRPVPTLHATWDVKHETV